ncbi:MAG: FAD-binding oxidoreductase [Rhizobiaceae bacterium]
MALDILHANDRKGTYPPSWYHATAHLLPEQPRLAGVRKHDVLVVGGGYSGLSAALHLASTGMDVALVDAHRVGWGASGRNGGQAGSGQRVDQDHLESMVGDADAAKLWQLGEEAKQLVRDLIARHGIDCAPVPGIIHADHKPRYVAHSHDYARKLNEKYGYGDIRFIDREEMRSLVASEDYHGGTLDTGSFHLHPLNYVLGLAEAALGAGVTIYEGTQITHISKGAAIKAHSAEGTIEAAHCVLACNGYLGTLEKNVARRVMPINNFVIATEPLGDEGAKALIANNAAVADSRFVINYFRLSADGRLLFGGGENYGYRFPPDIKAFVRKPMLEVFPQLKDVAIEYGWGGTLAITTNRLPSFQRLAPNLISISGYSGHGVTIATLAGKIAAEAVRGQAERFDLMAGLPGMAFPGGSALRWPLLVLAMTWFSMRDRL